MEWIWQGITTKTKFQGGTLETPMSIHSNRRKQHEEAGSAIGTALMLALGLALRLAHSDSIYEPLEEMGNFAN